MKLEYFWETEYKFGEFLKEIFGDKLLKKIKKKQISV